MNKATIEKLLGRLDEETKDGTDYNSRALFHLLSAYKEKIVGLTPDYFHKAFRQIDVTDNGHVDMAIWCLLHRAKTFWDVLESVQPEKKIREAAASQQADSTKAQSI